MSKNIVFGEFNSDNLGDILLGESQRYIYNKYGVEVSLLNLTNENSNLLRSKDSIIVKDYKKSLLKTKHRKLYQEYYLYRHVIDLVFFLLAKNVYYNSAISKISKADKVIIGGGQLFSDNSLRMLLHIYCITKTAEKLKIEKAIIGSGFPTPKTFISKKLMKSILKYYSKDNIFLRDKKSISVVNAITNLNLDYENILPDFAIAYVNELGNNLPKYERKAIGLAPISLECLNSEQRSYVFNQDDWWISMARIIENEGYQPLLFCHGTVTDYNRCKSIQEKAHNQGFEITLLPRPLDVKTYIMMVDSLKNVICQRLHVSITAFSLGKSPVSLPWDDKVLCFYNEAGMSEHFIDDKTPDYHEVFNKLSSNLDLSLQRKKLVDNIDSIISNISNRSFDK